MMQKAIIYRTQDGIEVIDNTIQAEDRLESMNYLEQRIAREHRWENNRRKQNPFRKIASACGIL